MVRRADPTGFNSLMVLLKASIVAAALVAVDLFSFLDGAIKCPRHKGGGCPALAFQFIFDRHSPCGCGLVSTP